MEEAPKDANDAHDEHQAQKDRDHQQFLSLDG
jgi:hypothetical protein